MDPPDRSGALFQFGLHDKFLRQAGDRRDHEMIHRCNAPLESIKSVRNDGFVANEPIVVEPSVDATRGHDERSDRQPTFTRKL